MHSSLKMINDDITFVKLLINVEVEQMNVMVCVVYMTYTRK